MPASSQYTRQVMEVTESSANAHSGIRLRPLAQRQFRIPPWLVLRTLLQAVFVFWSVPLVLHAIGPEANGAYNFAWGFGFLVGAVRFGPPWRATLVSLGLRR